VSACCWAGQGIGNGIVATVSGGGLMMTTSGASAGSELRMPGACRLSCAHLDPLPFGDDAEQHVISKAVLLPD
jgi:hypothetical protein